MEQNPVNEKPKHECKECGKKYEWKTGLSRHIRLLHGTNNTQSYKCEICDEVFTKKVGLSLHKKFHEKSIKEQRPGKLSKVYESTVSETVYSSDSDCEYEVLQTIVKVKPNSGSHKCTECPKGFKLSESLQRHLNKHRDNELIDLNSVANGDCDENSCQSEENSKHACKKCKKVFSTARNLANHMKMHLRRSVTLKRHQSKAVIIKNTYQCKFCSRVYMRQSHLDNHLVFHDTLPLQKENDKCCLCVVCGKGYTSSSHLSVHMRTHRDYKPHLCSECGKMKMIKPSNVV